MRASAKRSRCTTTGWGIPDRDERNMPITDDSFPVLQCASRAVEFTLPPVNSGTEWIPWSTAPPNRKPTKAQRCGGGDDHTRGAIDGRAADPIVRYRR